MAIFRQHDETDVYEIVGGYCINAIAIPSDTEHVIYALYLQVNDIWLRIFIQAWILFIDECEGPDSEDDLADGEEYIEIGKDTLIDSPTILSAKMCDGIFKIRLSNGISFRLSEVPNGTKLLIES